MPSLRMAAMVRPFLTKITHSERWWRQAACFALLALVTRALIPMGYMPVVPAQAATGLLWLSVCHTDSHVLQAVVVAALDDTEAPRSAAAMDCPFGLLAGAAGGPLPGALKLATWPTASASAPKAVSQPSLAPRLMGPPLGSRAPPVA